MFSCIFVVFSLAGYALAHGVVTTPKPRVAGAANEAACGASVYNVLKSDIFGPIENAVAKIDSAYDAVDCHLYFCRGYQLEDNIANTRAYSVGEVVPFKVDIEAHHTGYANMSVVDLAAQVPLARLLTWNVYANQSLGPSQWPANETSFSVTIPDLGDACTEVGACAIQWYWYATVNDQTYESCVDFTTA
ncbi:hypothetical protein BDZ89DRAFT_1061584 [Hymenopellis radicata]|nr:hypothetical protein BDZ89DRAFT_1061584 [Hymenopellis radicata]